MRYILSCKSSGLFFKKCKQIHSLLINFSTGSGFIVVLLWIVFKYRKSDSKQRLRGDDE